MEVRKNIYLMPFCRSEEATIQMMEKIEAVIPEGAKIVLEKKAFTGAIQTSTGTEWGSFRGFSVQVRNLTNSEMKADHPVKIALASIFDLYFQEGN